MLLSQYQSYLMRSTETGLEYLVALLMILEIAAGLKAAEYRSQYLLKNIAAVIFTLIFTGTIIYQASPGREPDFMNMSIHAARNIFLLYRLTEGLRSVQLILQKIHSRPALSILTSFALIILTGTLLLMLPFAAAGGNTLSFVDALFTATSAVCVTGLIVVDTAGAFSVFGKAVILMLIQTGGLGIMIIGYFSLFLRGRKISFREKQRLSVVISEADMPGISRALKAIVGITFGIEAAGAVVLAAGFCIKDGFSAESVFSGLFHSVSAFCNAGFSLYSDSLEGLADSPFFIFTIAALIIAGGLSFSVIFNIRDIIRRKTGRLNLNSRVVLSWSTVLVIGGMFLFYAAEHGGILRELPTPQQYLAAFFQSVTLRTAGFNSVGFGSFRTGTIMLMCIFMFIGAASGSTAGGIKINTAAVLAAYIKSILRRSPAVTIYRHQLSSSCILKAFIIFQYGIVAVFLSTIILSFTETAALRDIIFETVSAFGTVGLSTGLTPKLSTAGKFVIIFLMVNGRLGPLTILSSLPVRGESSAVRYPQGDIAIG